MRGKDTSCFKKKKKKEKKNPSASRLWLTRAICIAIMRKLRVLLQISSDRDDRRGGGGKNQKPKKSLGASNKTQKVPGLKFNAQNILCRISEP